MATGTQTPTKPAPAEKQTKGGNKKGKTSTGRK